jgi:type III secretion protein T
MYEAFQATHQLGKDALLALGLTLPRILVIFLFLPVFARQLMPGLLRSGVAAALAIPAAVLLLPTVQAAGALEAGQVLGILVKEALLGLVIGYILVIPFWALEAVGFLIDNQRGASIAATINPLTGHDTSPLGLLFNQAFIVFFLVSGGFLLYLEIIYDSYQLWPVTSAWPAFQPGFVTAALGLLDSMVRMAVLLAAPVMIAMFLAEVGLALVSRFVPQLQVFFLAMPIKSALAMLMLAIYAVVLFDYAGDHLRAMRDTLPRTTDTLLK